MTFEEFEKIQSEMFAKCRAMSQTKGKEYARGVDRFGNFNRMAGKLDLDRLKVAWIFVEKHIDSVLHFINTGEASVEGMESRFIDIMVYMTLIWGMILEDQQTTKMPDPAQNAAKQQNSYRLTNSGCEFQWEIER